jgi:hypothetical protein
MRNEHIEAALHSLQKHVPGGTWYVFLRNGSETIFDIGDPKVLHSRFPITVHFLKKEERFEVWNGGHRIECDTADKIGPAAAEHVQRNIETLKQRLDTLEDEKLTYMQRYAADLAYYWAYLGPFRALLPPKDA